MKAFSIFAFSQITIATSLAFMNFDYFWFFCHCFVFSAEIKLFSEGFVDVAANGFPISTGKTVHTDDCGQSHDHKNCEDEAKHYFFVLSFFMMSTKYTGVNSFFEK
jgi:hypothetical protein